MTIACSAPGVHDIPESAYHADPCPAPSLSHSILKTLLDRSPRHAWHAHPRLNPRPPERNASSGMDHGSILHKLILGKGAEIVPVTTKYAAKHKRAGEVVTDWKTDAAQEERAAIRKSGRLPILPCDLPVVQRCAEIAMAQMREHPDLAPFFGAGRSETVIAWQEEGFWFRAMIDRLTESGQPYDLKSTDLSAAPWSWERRLQREYATQDAFYRRGLKALGRPSPPLIFLPIEMDEPNCVSSLCVDASLQFWADQEIERGIAVWKDCLASGNWPAYPLTTYHASATGWMLTQQEERASAQPHKGKPKPSPSALAFAKGEWE